MACETRQTHALQRSKPARKRLSTVTVAAAAVHVQTMHMKYCNGNWQPRCDTSLSLPLISSQRLKIFQPYENWMCLCSAVCGFSAFAGELLDPRLSESQQTCLKSHAANDLGDRWLSSVLSTPPGSRLPLHWTPPELSRHSHVIEHLPNSYVVCPHGRAQRGSRPTVASHSQTPRHQPTVRIRQLFSTLSVFQNVSMRLAHDVRTVFRAFVWSNLIASHRPHSMTIATATY